MKRYEQGSVGMRPDPKGSWCDYIEAQAKIERLRKRNTEALKVRDAEIERLRGLLREILGKNRCRDMWLWNEDLHRRVRKALGE